MSNATHLLPADIRAAAHAMATARALRFSPARPPASLLDELPEDRFAEVVAEARAVVAALALLRAETPPEPRRRGPLNRTDAAALGLDLNAGTLLILARDRNGAARGVLWAISAEAAELSHADAQVVWTATAAALVRLAISESP